MLKNIIKIRNITISFLILLLIISISGCTLRSEKIAVEEEAVKVEESLTELKVSIIIKAEKELLHYQKESFWDDKNFSKILVSKKEIESETINSFKKGLEKYNLSVINPKIEFDKSNKITTLTCDLKGSMYKTDSYDFHWLLADLPFDLYQFQKSEKELTYKGEVGNVTTTIKLIFPYTLNHCHEHVWP